MSGTPKILLATLWLRTSERGNEYLSGFLGKARLIGFRGEPTADGTPTWDIYLQSGKEQEARAGAREQQPRQQTSSSTASRPAKVQRSPEREARKARPKPEPGDGRPWNDDISDIGRSR